jgi:hypothetical protein
MACKNLAERYVAENKERGPIPGSSATGKQKREWLLSGEWKCYKDGEISGALYTGDICKEQDISRAKSIHALNKHAATNYQSVYDIYAEEGFLNWVNERGPKCISSMVGNHYRSGLAPSLDPKHTMKFQTLKPNELIPQPHIFCADACQKYTTNSNLCFACIEDTLKHTNWGRPETGPNPCPGINATDPDIAGLVRDSVGCLSCKGTNFLTLPPTSASQNKVEDQKIDQVWGCVSGDFPFHLTQLWLVIIIIASVVLVFGSITVAVYYYYRRKRIQRILHPTDLYYQL